MDWDWANKIYTSIYKIYIYNIYFIWEDPAK